jgi:hypothetical protein
MNDSAKARLCLRQIVELFKTGAVPKALAVVTIPPQADIPSARWSWSNKLLQFLADTSDARGYRQWQQAGRHVKQGSKSFHILGPKIIKIKRADDDNNDTEKPVVTGFFSIPVFRAEDTDGEPLSYEPASPPPLTDVAERFGLSVSYQVFAGSHYGCYQKKSKKIILATHEAQVFFHELAHAAHDRIAGKLKGGQVPSQEIIAELTAATLSNLYCPEANLGFSYKYVKAYARESRKSVERACLAVINTTGKVLEEILNPCSHVVEKAA